jgi:hypothetical protein
MWLLLGLCGVLAGSQTWEQSVQQWYSAVPGALDTLNTTLARAALAQQGRPYSNLKTDPENPIPVLDSFQCVSLVESSIALASCLHQHTPTAACFKSTLFTWRYRSHPEEPFEDKLHYFYEWLLHHTAQGRLENIQTPYHVVEPYFRFNYVSTHLAEFPPLQDKKTLRTWKQREKTLSQKGVTWIPKKDIAQADAFIKMGDIIGIVTDKPGIFIAHVGVAWKDDRNTTHLIHASSFHQKVVLTEASLTSYLHANPHRSGVVVFRMIE